MATRVSAGRARHPPRARRDRSDDHGRARRHFAAVPGAAQQRAARAKAGRGCSPRCATQIAAAGHARAGDPARRGAQPRGVRVRGACADGAQAGVSEAKIDAVRDAARERRFAPLERAVLELTDAMTRDVQVGDALFDPLRAHFDTRAWSNSWRRWRRTTWCRAFSWRCGSGIEPLTLACRGAISRRRYPRPSPPCSSARFRRGSASRRRRACCATTSKPCSCSFSRSAGLRERLRQRRSTASATTAGSMPAGPSTP